jgi:hypothetical protein
MVGLLTWLCQNTGPAFPPALSCDVSREDRHPLAEERDVVREQHTNLQLSPFYLGDNWWAEGGFYQSGAGCIRAAYVEVLQHAVTAL